MRTRMIRSRFFMAVLGLQFVANAAFSQWQQAGGQFGYNATTLAANGTTIFAAVQGSSENRLLRSTDNGSTWANTSLPTQTVIAMAANGNTILIYRTTSQVASSFARSLDNGVTWNELTTVGLPNVNTVVAKNGKFYAGTQRGVYVSSDDGTTWTSLGLESVAVTSIALQNTTILAGGTGTIPGNIFRSTDNGRTWSNIYTFSFPSRITALCMNSNTMFAAITPLTIDSPVSSQTIRSFDNGETWFAFPLGDKLISSLIANDNVVYAGARTRSNFIFRSGILDSGGVFRSLDNGTTWTAFHPDATNRNVSMLLLTQNSLFAATAPAGVSDSAGGRIFRTSLGVTSVRNQSEDVPMAMTQYPNPCSERATIEYHLNKTAFVSVELISPLGQVVARLLNQEQGAGRHSIDIDTRAYPNGVYFYRLGINEGLTTDVLHVIH